MSFLQISIGIDGGMYEVGHTGYPCYGANLLLYVWGKDGSRKSGLLLFLHFNYSKGSIKPSLLKVRNTRVCRLLSLLRLATGRAQDMTSFGCPEE